MTGGARSEQTVDIAGQEGLDSVALVPTGSSPRRLEVVPPIARPDPTFVTHLIATAAQLPQTRHLRRAAPADAALAYAAKPIPQTGTGGRTRRSV
jgi:hypothetical protein